MLRITVPHCKPDNYVWGISKVGFGVDVLNTKRGWCPTDRMLSQEQDESAEKTTTSNMAGWEMGDAR